jgi:hypothetical protein
MKRDSSGNSAANIQCINAKCRALRLQPFEKPDKFISTNMAQEPVNQEAEDQDLLLALIFGVLHEEEIVGGAEFAAKLAICARMTNGNEEEYGKAVKRVLIAEENVLDLFPERETELVVQRFLRAIRKSRNNAPMLTWLGEQFPEKKEIDVVKNYLVAVERALANTMIGRH